MSAPPPSSIAPAPPAAPAGAEPIPGGLAGNNPRLGGAGGFAIGLVMFYFAYVRPMQQAQDGEETVFFSPRLATFAVMLLLGTVPAILFGHTFVRVLGLRMEGGRLRRGPLFYVYMIALAAAGVAALAVMESNLSTMGYSK